MNWNSHLGGTKFPAPLLYNRWASFKWISSFRGTISVTVTTQSITVSCRGSHFWGCTSQCIASENLLITRPTILVSFFVVKLQSPESPHQFSSCFIDALEEELLIGIYFFTLHVCIQIQHDSNVYHQGRSFLGTRFHAWWTISGSEKNLLSWRSCQILWQMSLIHQFLKFVISFSWKMQQRIQLQWIPDNNWWLIFGHGSIPNNFYQESVHDFWGNFTKLKTMTGEDSPTPRNHLEMHGRQFSFQLFDWLQDTCKTHGTHVKNVILVNHFSDSHLLKIVVQQTWSCANSHSIPKNQGHSKIPKVYKVMLVKTQLLHFALVRISCRTRCLKQRTAGSGIFQTRKGSKLKNRSVGIWSNLATRIFVNDSLKYWGISWINYFFLGKSMEMLRVTLV